MKGNVKNSLSFFIKSKKMRNYYLNRNLKSISELTFSQKKEIVKKRKFTNDQKKLKSLYESLILTKIKTSL